MRDWRSYRILLFVNQNANSGTARRKWERIRSRVLKRLPPETTILEYRSYNGIEAQLDHHLSRGVDGIISAGGDGTLNWLINTLMDFRGVDLHRFFIGAIGLGSSNDFLKPAGEFVNGIPVRLNFNNMVRSDLGKVTFTNTRGNDITRYFIINASLGVTSEANLFFNHGDQLLNFLKKKAKHLAIFYAAIRAILFYKNFAATLGTESGTEKINISNLGVIKNPFVSGGLRYDQAIGKDDGKLGLNYCNNMDKIELLKTLLDLARGKFSGQAKRVSCFIKSLSIETEKTVALETDGEVFQGTNFRFSVLPGVVNTLGS